MKIFKEKTKTDYEQVILILSEDYAPSYESDNKSKYNEKWILNLLTDFNSNDFKKTLNLVDQFKETIWIESFVRMGYNLETDRKELDKDFYYTKKLLNDFLLMRNLYEKNIDLKKEKKLIEPKQIKNIFDISYNISNYILKNKDLYDKDITKTVFAIEKICKKIYKENLEKDKKYINIEL